MFNRNLMFAYERQKYCSFFHIKFQTKNISAVDCILHIKISPFFCETKSFTILLYVPAMIRCGSSSALMVKLENFKVPCRKIWNKIQKHKSRCFSSLNFFDPFLLSCIELLISHTLYGHLSDDAVNCLNRISENVVAYLLEKYRHISIFIPFMPANTL